jgi:hypothetical protein
MRSAKCCKGDSVVWGTVMAVSTLLAGISLFHKLRKNPKLVLYVNLRYVDSKTVHQENGGIRKQNFPVMDTRTQ